MLFRFGLSAGGGSATSQIVAVGLFGEVGRQWGLSFGVVDRIAVSPTYMNGANPDSTQAGPHWSMAGGARGPLIPLRWHFSPFYLRVEDPGLPVLVARRLYGVQIAAGPEARAASLGVVSLVRVDVPDDAISLIDYNSEMPMAARVRVWRAGPHDDLSSMPSLQEISP